MKKMYVTTLILSLFMVFSCTDQEQSLIQEELNSDTVKTAEAIAAKTAKDQEDEYLYGIQIYYSSAEAEIKRLELIKTKLVTEMENGNKKVIEDIENTQIQIEKLSRFNEDLKQIKPPKSFPTPYPCFDGEVSNCNPKRKLSPETLILLGNDLIVTNVIIKNTKNEIVESKFQPIEDQYSQQTLLLKSNFKGEGIMYTTIKTKVVDEITIPTPVVSF